MRTQLEQIPKETTEIFSFAEKFFKTEKSLRDFRLNIIGLKNCFPPGDEKDYYQQKTYIDKVLMLINPLFQYYELGQIFFDFLIQAVINVEKLSFFESWMKVLPEYFEKAAMIFQIAADKTEITERKISFVKRAQEYIKKADAVRSKLLLELLPLQSHEKRMARLFQAAANDANMPEYNKPYFQELAVKYGDEPRGIYATKSVTLKRSEKINPTVLALKKRSGFFRKKPVLREKSLFRNSFQGEGEETPLLFKRKYKVE